MLRLRHWERHEPDISNAGKGANRGKTPLNLMLWLIKSKNKKKNFT